MSSITSLSQRAPSAEFATAYDRAQLALYAALLDSADRGRPWQDAAREIMGIDVAAEGAEACWRSHLERACWIVGDGLEAALASFGAKADRSS
jgi:hypothetical protein